MLGSKRTCQTRKCEYAQMLMDLLSSNVQG